MWRRAHSFISRDIIYFVIHFFLSELAAGAILVVLQARSMSTIGVTTDYPFHQFSRTFDLATTTLGALRENVSAHVGQVRSFLVVVSLLPL